MPLRLILMRGMGIAKGKMANGRPDDQQDLAELL